MTSSDLISLRERMKWSQSEAARQLGCSTRSIVNWESGDYLIPKSIALATSAVLMNVPPYGVINPYVAFICDFIDIAEAGMITNQPSSQKDSIGYLLHNAHLLKDYASSSNPQ